ncbi:DUF302 domain-containing protein [Neptunomonas phycophila]|uniref:DUF302 domain-containing protein n=1 Tax=Neptunomonas phycophila TaxID=1572645 RepID=UPI001BE8E2E8|nr:DUF302 domain-containing protein [Neptunomonas phycophila]MBT3147425.1 DUF302 domain-containing protein [Neptunomonas phycophila]MDO6469498.1 DUF302 domain-containing protein [Neptunomonas phycophila]
MVKSLSLGVALAVFSLSASAEDSLVKYESIYSVKETADRFENIAKSKGLTVFTRINHQQNAANVGLELRPTEVIIFGNPKVGTPLMQCSQDVAIDLPQKVMITEDSNNKVWLSYNNPNYLVQRHSIEGCDEVIKKVSGVLGALSTAAVAQ